MTHSPLTWEVLDLLVREFGQDLVLREQDLDDFGRDESGLAARPEALLRARNTEQISRLLTLANDKDFAVTPRGGGSGLAGGCVPFQGGVLLSLADMNEILSIDTRDMIAVTQPGVITQDLKQAIAAQGLFYPPDPAGMDLSTIGGNAATDAGGPACVKYGVTREYILGLEAVLPSGQVIRTGSMTRKNVVGYDLTRLLIGSEGTLGVITELTLKLVPLPGERATAVAVFPDLASAMRAVTEIMVQGCDPSALEFMDYRCLDLVRDLLPIEGLGDSSDHKASLLLMETDGRKGRVREDLARMQVICKEMGATHVLPANDERERENLWSVRRQVSLRIHDRWPVYVPEDVAVPLGRIDELVAALPAVEQRYGLTIYAFGHSGDGNIHLNVTAEKDFPRDKLEEALRELLEMVTAMGGVISGEHGIGTAKKRFVPLQLAEANIEAQRAIKKALDPNMVLNPGKVLPET